MIVKGIQVRFDRIMRVTLWAGGSTAETVIMEYAPLADERLCPTMQVQVRDIINPSNGNGLPGFTAEVTFTNPPPQVRRILANHMTWLLDYTEAVDSTRSLKDKDAAGKVAQSQKNLQDFYNSRVRVRIEAGYWHEGMRQYNKIFEGYVNSNTWYRKGVDNILTLAAYNIDISKMNSKALTDVGAITCPTDIDRYVRESMGDEEKRSGRNTASWMAMARKLVLNFSDERPNPAYAPGSTIVLIPPYIKVQEKDRTNESDWYQIKPIFTPRKKSEFNEELWYKLQELKVDRFYTNAGSLENMIAELTNYNHADVNFEIDDEWTQGVRTLFVWPRGQENKYTVAADADIKIINYQNLLEAPAVTADGSLNIKMLFNPACQPNLNLALVLDSRQGSDTATGDSTIIRAGKGLNDTASFAGSLNPYTPTQQGPYTLGLYTQEIEAFNNKRLEQDKITHGYIFNTGFPIREVTHSLSTRANEWSTTVVTIPMNVGIQKVALVDKGK